MQRRLPPKLISSQKAAVLLQEHYGINHAADQEGSYYFFTDAHSYEEMKFRDVEDLRDNLCAYGLPSMEGQPIDVEDQFELEFWIRCAPMKGLINESAVLPNHCGVDYQEAKTAIKSLGYKMSKNANYYTLPNAKFHNPSMNEDGWNNLLDFLNHIARFGLVEPGNSDAKSPLSNEAILRFQMFVASIATFDIW